MNNDSTSNGGRSNFTLEYEIWMWRGAAVFILLLVLLTNIITFIVDRSQHNKENIERAAAWQTIIGNVTENRAALNRNSDAIQLVDEHLRQCSGCHSHPAVLTGKGAHR
jgi:hypothetical protein